MNGVEVDSQTLTFEDEGGAGRSAKAGAHPAVTGEDPGRSVTVISASIDAEKAMGVRYESEDGDRLSGGSGTPPPPEDNERDAPSAMTVHRQMAAQGVARVIAAAKSQGARVLDLRKMAMKELPAELLELAQLQYLYLEGNHLTHLPDDFFDRLPELQWLDLRRNYLMSLPSTYVGSHHNLRTLLLEGNNLKTLPLELGLVTTLKGLNICNNPLEFPPVEVIERGTQAVLQFLRDLLQAKSQGRLDDEGDVKEYSQFITLDLSHAPRINNLSLDDSDGTSASEDEWCQQPRDLTPSARQLQRWNSMDSRGLDSAQSDSDLIGPVPTSAALHRPANYNEIKQKQMEKFKRAGALGTVEKKPKPQLPALLAPPTPAPSFQVTGTHVQSPTRLPPHRAATSHGHNVFLTQRNFSSERGSFSRHRKPSKKERRLMKVSMYPEPPPVDRVQQRFLEERHLHQVREIKEQQDQILQRRKDQEELRKWRDDGKRLQQDRYMEARIYGGAKDPVDVATKAPFGIEQSHLKVVTNEERIAQAVKETHEKMRKRRAVSPRTQAKLEAERLIMNLDKDIGMARDRELERKIKSHMLAMQERRRQPKGTPQEEMEIARRELDIANKLQAEVEARRKALEYRFTAFTGAP